MSKEKIGIGEKLGAQLKTVDQCTNEHRKVCECTFQYEGCKFHPEDKSFTCRTCGGVILAKKSS